MHYGYPKIGGFGGFMGENLKFYYSKPKKELPYPETRLLTYSAWKSVQRCGLYPSSRTAKIVKKKYHGGCIFHVYAGKNPFSRFLPKLGYFN